MKIRGSELVVQALEDEGARFTFGIPGTHNIELYDALERSESIRPILVTDEQSASFMADAVSRSSDSIGVVNVVPGAGLTHALSGIAEAWMDNIPIVVLTCGIRTDTGKSFQLHDVDQLAIAKPVTKAVLRPESPALIYATVRQAFRIARTGCPGPVLVEIPANFYMLTLDVDRPERVPGPASIPRLPDIEEAARLLLEARHPAIYAGFGARHATAKLKLLAEELGAPVATTIQGKGVFPERHPLWLWNGFGPSAPPFVRAVMDRTDCLLAIGCRFGEVATASYGLRPPENLIHVDIDETVLGCNYPVRLGIASDAGLFLDALYDRLLRHCKPGSPEAEIRLGHEKLAADRHRDASRGRVSPSALFGALQRLARQDAIYTTDSGNGTFLAMEHLRLEQPGRFLAPVDYSCMGYAVPAAIGAKLANPDRDVIAIAGDGALLMTGLEMLTAAAAPPLVCVLRDQELGQIAQFQRTALDRDTCSVLPPFEVESLARAVGARYFHIANDSQVGDKLTQALQATREGHPAMAEVDIDYSCKTFFTRGVVTTNFWRLPWPDRLRMAARAASRKLQRALGSPP